MLDETRFHGNWESWLEFFLKGVKETAEQATESAQRILKLFEENNQRIRTLGRASASALLLHDYLQGRPVTNLQTMVNCVNVSLPTATKAMKHLENLGLVRETTCGKRNRIYAYDAYLNILEQGTEPLKS